MKYFKISVVLLLSILLFSGCIQVDTKVKLKKDGSGTIEEKVMMSSMVVEMMNQFMGSFQDSTGETEKFSLFKEDELKDKSYNYGEGVKYVSGKEIKEDGWEGYQAVYSFKDINTLKMDTDPNKKVDLDEGGSEASDEYFSFHFKPGSVAELTINRPDMNMKEAEEETEDSENTENHPLDDKIVKMMDGMRIKISLQPEGSIVSTNASYVDGSDVTLIDIDFSKILKNKESLEMLKQNPPKSLEEMEAIVKNIPGMKIELQKSLSIKFN